MPFAAMFTPHPLQSALLTPVDRLSLVDALAHLSSPPVTQLLTQHILRAGSHDPDSSELMERALFHFATSLNADRYTIVVIIK